MKVTLMIMYLTWMNAPAIVQKDVFLIEIKRGVLPEYQIKIADSYSNSIGNVKKLVPNIFDKEKYILHYENLQLCLRLWLKLKNEYITYQNLISHNGWKNVLNLTQKKNRRRKIMTTMEKPYKN